MSSRRVSSASAPSEGCASNGPRIHGRVLVVDDTDSKRYLIAQTLRLAGMEVVEAETGRGALAAAVGQPDVVLLDVRLPDMSGFEVCHLLKTQPATAAIPVLYVSALMEDAELESRLFEDGADGYVPQPIEPKHLVAQTWALVRMRRGELQRERERDEAGEERQRLYRELESSEGRLRLALDAAELGTWNYDLGSHVYHCDARAREVFGLAEGAPVDLARVGERLHPEDRAEMMEAARRCLAGESGGMFQVEGRTVDAGDGRVRWVSVRGRMRFTPDGRVEDVAGICQDITERAQAERRATDFLATTAAFAHALTPEEVCGALLTHGLQSMGAFAGIVALVDGDVLRPLMHNGYQEGVIQPTCPLFETLPFSRVVRTGRPVQLVDDAAIERDWPAFTREVRDARGRAWLGVPLREGLEVVGLLWLSFATPRRFSVAELAQVESLCQLCTQALGRARLFEDERLAKEEARHQESLEQRFLGMVSHDLRNPLQAISLGARTLQRMENPPPATLLRMTSRIAHSADLMGNMVSDLLDFTRGRLGGGLPLARASVDLVLLGREVLEEFSLTHPGGRVVLEGPGACLGDWDGPRLRQVLCNLVGNALRHARVDTAVRVRVSHAGSEALLEVHNEGEPIPESLLPVLFEPFRRGVSSFRPAGSLGLGLYIVRQVVDGHGGHVEVRTGEVGTTFLVRLPTREVAALG
ncbi:hybrid sensor histidine kinase/response regulator [Archangium primigenium]|uniref:hybrid sensor histidine kinase/response regulator n=1 Tax=[Archangium] primigenium TaxID=2792470 RepID=UPI00195C6A5B|nr:hybrid sensor histidine kinase/response regulator [Archangium primigenium]MBM7112346.1 response regulator [Archangium primigenium]